MNRKKSNFAENWWPRGLTCRSEYARFLGLRVQIPPGAWITVS